MYVWVAEFLTPPTLNDNWNEARARCGYDCLISNKIRCGKRMVLWIFSIRVPRRCVSYKCYQYHVVIMYTGTDFSTFVCMYVCMYSQIHISIAFLGLFFDYYSSSRWAKRFWIVCTRSHVQNQLQINNAMPAGPIRIFPCKKKTLN